MGWSHGPAHTEAPIGPCPTCGLWKPLDPSGRLLIHPRPPQRPILGAWRRATPRRCNGSGRSAATWQRDLALAGWPYTYAHA